MRHRRRASDLRLRGRSCCMRWSSQSPWNTLRITNACRFHPGDPHMLQTILIGAVGSLVFGLTMVLFNRARERESDPSGNPTLRYVAAPYVTLVCAACFLAVAIIQWLDPVNHRYSGNLLLLSYVPAAVGVFGHLPFDLLRHVPRDAPQDGDRSAQLALRRKAIRLGGPRTHRGTGRSQQHPPALLDQEETRGLQQLLLATRIS